MATPLLFRSRPRCLGCLRRQTAAVTSALNGSFINGSSNGGGLDGGLGSSSLLVAGGATQQVRGKKRGRPRDQGVVVRLLQDAATYGRRGAVFRTERGRMRNLLHPRAVAEYVTAARFAELGLSPAHDVGERDFQFGLGGLPVVEDDQPKQARLMSEVPSLLPGRIAELLNTLLPPVLTFFRKPIPTTTTTTTTTQTQQKRTRSPLLAAIDDDDGGHDGRDETTVTTAAAAVFGSVSPEDVALKIRELLEKVDGEDRHHAEARLVRVEGRHVRFLLPEGADNKLKALGRYEVEITTAARAAAAADAAAAGGAAPQPVWRVVEVVAEGTA